MFVVQYCSKLLIFDPIYTIDSYNNIQHPIKGVSISACSGVCPRSKSCFVYMSDMHITK